MEWIMAAAMAATAIAGMIQANHSSKKSEEVYNDQKDTQADQWEDQKDFAREQFEAQKDMAYDMMNKANAYNSPIEQVQRLQAAGINPQVAFDKNLSSIPSSSGTATTNVPSPLPLPNPSDLIYGQATYSNAIEGIKALSSAAKDLENSYLNHQQSKQIKETLSSQVALLANQAKNEELKNVYQQMQNTIQSAYGMKQAHQVLRNLEKIYDVYQSQSDLAKAQADVEWINYNIRDLDHRILYNNFKALCERENLINNQITAQTNQSDSQTNLNNVTAAYIPYNSQTQRISANAAATSASAALLSARTGSYLAKAQSTQMMSLARLYDNQSDYTQAQTGLVMIEMANKELQGSQISATTDLITEQYKMAVKQNNWYVANQLLNIYFTTLNQGSSGLKQIVK